MVPKCFYNSILLVRLAGTNSLIFLGGGPGGGGGGLFHYMC